MYRWLNITCSRFWRQIKLKPFVDYPEFLCSLCPSAQVAHSESGPEAFCRAAPPSPANVAADTRSCWVGLEERLLSGNRAAVEEVAEGKTGLVRASESRSASLPLFYITACLQESWLKPEWRGELLTCDAFHHCWGGEVMVAPRHRRVRSEIRPASEGNQRLGGWGSASVDVGGCSFIKHLQVNLPPHIRNVPCMKTASPAVWSRSPSC